MNDRENRIPTGPWPPDEANTPTPPSLGVPPAPQAETLPLKVGRYRVVRLLGEGGFGRVYLAQDDQLGRPVAIKVPHRRLLTRPQDALAYLMEARTVANLDHPNIVPVHDVGSTEDCPFFIVSKYIEGCTLAQKMKGERPSVGEIVELVATVAEALHYAHRQGLVHRDVKPGNILLDAGGKPYVADFGLALREADLGKGPGFAGTPAYMSPEQARGEGHRVDGRSDVFSLGVVFYELLTGRRPFRGDTVEEVLEQVTDFEPRPPRQHDDAIPKELERICFKALAKRATERYSTAKDLADDLRHFLAAAPEAEKSTLSRKVSSDPPAAATPLQGPEPTPTPDSRPVQIVPKGLRSFDAHDADFFLELLPGPRDREGLPDSLRFWKTRIEEPDPDNTFAVGLIYGPSGCGKSSLVKAGLLPRLSEKVIAVYVEATAGDTEARLLSGLRKRCPPHPQPLSPEGRGEKMMGLKETLAALRRGQGIPAGIKVLLVLDQFEQWLHARREEESTELVQALRQCDGGRLQGVVLVRDDFWMAATRFMRELEVRLVEGQNSAAVDLFPVRHAEKVLAAFGRAFGVLADSPGEVRRDQRQFLEQAVLGLAQERKVICVRLALFAEMLKGRPWTPASLKAVGGAAGVGVSFLEETFSAATAPPEHRYHQKAARAVLKALLPESGSDIKGGMRSHADLLEASGYASRPREFADLLRILDGEIRLITPTDPEGVEQASGGREPPVSSPEQGADAPRSPEKNQGAHAPRSPEKYYQLTHDYLVPSLRDWLTRKQKETRRGRAELLLADRAAVWNARPENRQLPSVPQWLSIRLLTRRKNWTPPQRKMMRRATRYHALRGILLAVVLALIGWGGYEGYGTFQAHALRDQLLKADTAKVLDIVAKMAPYRRWIDPLLHDAYQEAEANQQARKQLHASLALLPADPGQVEYLYNQLLGAQPNEVPVLRDALAPHKETLLDKLWHAAERPAKGQEPQRLRAAAALANYDADSPRWAKVQGPVASDLVGVPALHLALWKDAFQPVRGQLQAPLEGIYRNGQRRDAERSLATDLLAEYAGDKPQVLADLLMDADAKPFTVLFPKLKGHGERALTSLLAEADKKLLPDAKEEDKEKLAKRQANAAVALLRLGRAEKVWPVLKHRPDPRTRSYLIHRLGPLGADAKAVVRRLEDEPDESIRRALLLSLGEFGEEALSPAERDGLVKRLQEMYRTADDPGLRAAAEWLLRHGKQDRWLQQDDAAWAKDKLRRKERLLRVYKELAKGKEAAKPQWYATGQGQTMVVLPEPVEVRMGSPPTEASRNTDEQQHTKRIGRTFALAAKAVTVEQFLKFRPSHEKILLKRYTPTGDCPVNGETWFEAAEYCNWLSKEEGLPEDQWCYETNAQGKVLKLKANYLSLPGYRLPTEAEMEYACRAGAVTARYYGETDELLKKYAWYLGNSAERTWPVGSLKPNDLGLFDMHGNVLCWCQERYLAYPQSRVGKVIDDIEDKLSINTQDSRVLRGGAFYPASDVRSARRNRYVPSNRYFNVGFRPARTLLLDTFTALPPAEGGSATK